MSRTFAIALAVVLFTGTAHAQPIPSDGLCRSGRMQSPIDLRDADAAEMRRLAFDYRLTPLEMRLKDGVLRLIPRPGSVLRVGPRRYELTDIVFREPGEHTINGQSFPLEVQFRHQDDRGTLAIVAVPVIRGGFSLAMRELQENLPDLGAPVVSRPDVLVNPRDLLPFEQTYFRYMGSLSEPPCTEGVNWYVLKTPIRLGGAQIKALKGAAAGNARPVQQRNNRLILEATGVR